MPREISAHRCPEDVVAEHRSQHGENEAPLLVEMPIEDVDRRVVVLTHDGPPVATTGLDEVRFEVASQRIIVFVFAELVLEVEVLEEGGESLVQPAMGPIAAGDVVAEPLVGQLVRDQVVRRHVDRRPLVEKNVLVHRRGGRIFHAAEDEVGHHDLRVLVPRVRHTEQLAEVLDHLRCPAERAPPIRFATFRDEVGDRHAGRRAAVDFGEFAGDQRHQIARQRIAHRPAVAPRWRALSHVAFDQLAVRKGVPAPRDLHRKLEGHFEVRLVVAGKPMSGVFVLTLRPDLPRSILHVLVGLEKVKPALRRRAIGDAKLRSLLRGSDGHAQDAAVVHVVLRSSLAVEALHSFDFEAHRVQAKLGCRRIDAFDVEGRHAGHRLLGHVEAQVECEVANTEGTRTLVNARCAGQRERPGSAQHRGRTATGMKGNHGDWSLLPSAVRHWKCGSYSTRRRRPWRSSSTM